MRQGIHPQVFDIFGFLSYILTCFYFPSPSSHPFNFLRSPWATAPIPLPSRLCRDGLQGLPKGKVLCCREAGICTRNRTNPNRACCCYTTSRKLIHQVSLFCFFFFFVFNVFHFISCFIKKLF